MAGGCKYEVGSNVNFAARKEEERGVDVLFF